MPAAIGFDVYGTLVDPLMMQQHLHTHVGDGAARFAAVWRETQIAYAFRRALMRRYVDFDVCTMQALAHTARTLGAALSDDDRECLLARYRQLDPFHDAAPALAALQAQGHILVAFSNGVAASLRALLDHAGLLDWLVGIVSVDDVRTFKPDPAVYHYLARRLNTPLDETWLVSSNGWDVIGAKAAGLRAAWVRRNPAQVFDPWEYEPDIIVRDLEELAKWFGERACAPVPRP
jgi:2-haloacid dehalogenase